MTKGGRMAIKITKGSGNVFRDIGFSPREAEHLRVRAELIVALERLIARRRLTQAKAATLLGISQPRVNDLVRGRLHRFSIDALVDMLARAGVRVRFTTERGARVA
jgi:predicted XRE-type DNA-binding protein